MRIRQASPEDAAGIVAVWECIAAEKIYSAVDKPWSVEQQSSYLRSLSPREAFHVALDADGSIVGFQSLDLWSTLFGSMSHVGQVGTFLLPEWRRCGAGTALMTPTSVCIPVISRLMSSQRTDAWQLGITYFSSSTGAV